ncbi:MAG TPA: DNA alkylation repair protein [Candidatus Aquilonibacter sp.]|nr:DNA alkylation repair protein [Candidatus Aquilonibacter sp.]
MKLSPANQTPSQIAAQIRRALKKGGSAEHVAGMQRFFKEKIESHGWRTADLRRVARRLRKEIRNEHGLEFLVQIADQLFSGSVLEEKIVAVFLLEKLDGEFGDREFNLFESWLDRIGSWSDHDALVHDLISPLLIAAPARVRTAMNWAKSPNRWRRRAAGVALIRGTRAKMFFPEVTELSDSLLAEKDEMVQKGLGWLLRETAKFDAKRALPYLMKIRDRAPRLVLRTACETLPPKLKRKILTRRAAREPSGNHR